MNAEETTLLLTRLLESFVEFPRELAVTFREMHGRTDWKVQGSINDQGKLVGKEASHIKAVKFLMAELGDRHGQEYQLKLVDPEPGERLPPSKKKLAGPEYRCEKMQALLQDWLTALLDAPPFISVGHTHTAEAGSTFIFSIKAQRIQDHKLLLSPVDGEPDDASILTSLGALFRAAGFIEGVIFKIEVPMRK